MKPILFVLIACFAAGLLKKKKDGPAKRPAHADSPPANPSASDISATKKGRRTYINISIDTSMRPYTKYLDDLALMLTVLGKHVYFTDVLLTVVISQKDAFHCEVSFNLVDACFREDLYDAEFHFGPEFRITETMTGKEKCIEDPIFGPAAAIGFSTAEDVRADIVDAVMSLEQVVNDSDRAASHSVTLQDSDIFAAAGGHGVACRFRINHRS